MKKKLYIKKASCTGGADVEQWVLLLQFQLIIEMLYFEFIYEQRTIDSEGEEEIVSQFQTKYWIREKKACVEVYYYQCDDDDRENFILVMQFCP